MRIINFSVEDDISEEPNSKLMLRFVRNMKYSDLFARNMAELDKWVEMLSKVMIRIDFHQRFKVERQLGEGSFAKVYLAKNMVSGEQFAVKAFTKARLEKQNKGKQAIKNEIEMLMKLDHPNLAKLWEVHESKNSLYLVCEYLGGGSLNDYLRRLDDYLHEETISTILQ